MKTCFAVLALPGSLLWLFLSYSEGAPRTDSGLPPASADQPPEVSLQIMDYESLKSLIASHKGKVVVVDVWATTCPPCIKEFPGLVELHRQYGAEKVACISVSSDYTGRPGQSPEDLHPKVLAFLQRQKATFDNVLSSTADSELYRRLGIAAIPAVFVYGPDGKLAKRFGESGEEFTYENDVIPFVERLLAESGKQE